MGIQNKVVALEEIRNEKAILQEELKKEIEQSEKYRFNNIIRIMAEQKMDLTEYDRRFRRLELMMEKMMSAILEK